MLAATGTVGGTAVVLVPAQDPAPPPGKGPEFGNASPVGLVVVLALLVVTVFLIRGMSKRIRRLPESFDSDAAAADGAGTDAAGTEGAGTDGAGTDGADAGTVGADASRTAATGSDVAEVRDRTEPEHGVAEPRPDRG